VRRQYPIENYIVDFAIRKTRLVIEIDGGIHKFEHVKAGDKIRDERLEVLGWKVLHISTEIAMTPDLLMAIVQKELGL